MKKIFSILFLVLSYVILFSQTNTVTYNTPFHTSNQSLWQQGTDGSFEINHTFFNQTWNNSANFGPITNIAGYSFGANVTAGTWGQVGTGLQINFGTEKVSIDYNADMLIERPNNFTFNKGEQITIKTAFTPKSPSISIIETDTYDANIRLYLQFGMGIDINANICMFSCTNTNIVNINLPSNTYDMVHVSSTEGINLLNGMLNFPADEFPFEYQDPYDIITAEIDMPSNEGANHFLDGKNLHSFVDPDNPYFNVYFSIPKFIGALNIPYVSAIFANLSNSYTAGPFYLHYILMESGFNLGLYHKQHLKLEPEIKGKMSLPTVLDYQIINPSNGSVIASGTDSVINYTVGNNIRFDYPCNFEFMDITPSFNIENTFSNHTYDSIALDFVFQMLEFDMGMSSVTVVPQVCFPVYYPCPTWSNPLKMCKRTVCTPAVVFPGFNTGFGPLIDWQPNMFNIKYDWINSSWEMLGFNSFENMDPFRLEPLKFEVELNVEHILCHGDSTGTATASVTNGIPPYTYEWSNGEVVTTNQTTNTQTGLAAGTHYVIVRDSKNCSTFDSKVIEQPEMPLNIVAEIVEPLCYESYDGYINLNVTGGTPEYSFLWSNSETSQNLTNLDSGVYQVTVTDSNNCQISDLFELHKPEGLKTDAIITNVRCKGENNGSVVLETNGGVSPYSYNWSNENTESSDLNLSAGDYSITITDYNNCVEIITVSISEPELELSGTVEIANIQCHGDNSGAAEVTVSGGTLPYSFIWYSPDNNILNNTSHNLTNISAGNYSVIVYDSLDCSLEFDFTVFQPEPLEYSFDIQHVLCKGFETGYIDAAFSGGTPPYQFLWSDGSEDENLTDVPAGDYSLTVTDANNCEYVFNNLISEPNEHLLANTTITDVRCYGDLTGAISVQASGGTPPYHYLWSNDSTQSELNNLPSGTYTVTVTDANDCLSYSGGVIKQPDAVLEIIAEVYPVSCYGYSNGKISLEILGGTLPYSYIWDDHTYVMSSDQQVLSGLKTGVYNISIVDANNCTNSYSYYIETPEPAEIEISSSIVSCYNGEDGTINVEVNGGTPPYQFIWNNGYTGSEIDGISAGNYNLTVTDSNNCPYTASHKVTSMPRIIVSSEVKHVSCRDVDDGSIYITPGGGTETFFYSWSSGETLQNITGLAPGTYTLLLTDSNNCEKNLDFYIEDSFDECLRIPTSFTPNDDGINDTWVISNIDAYPNAVVQIFNNWGTILFETQGAYNPWDGSFNGNPVPSGVYYYIIDLRNGDEPYTGTVTILR